MFRYNGTEKLRCGYTTGTCAAAAAGAAAVYLLTGKAPSEISVRLPGGDVLRLPVSEPFADEHSADCGIVKDSGDDPDITNGITVRAEVICAPEGITITGGEGIGKVTKPGLDQPVGEWAINSTPRRMIAETLAETAERLGYEGGFQVKLYVPGGAALAEKTYNPHMGILGGISIIGTTGIVEPMSTRALIETIRTEAAMHRAQGETLLILTLGNYSEQFVRMALPVASDRTVTCSNFIGEALDIGITLGFEKILLIGHAGKLVKLGAGIMNTHSAQADGRMETLVTCGVLAGADVSVLRQLPDCVTVDAALDILEAAGVLEQTMHILTERIAYHLQKRVRSALPVEAVLFTFQENRLYMTEGAPAMLAEAGATHL